MYGLINRALGGLIRSEYGDHIWRQVCREAGLDDPEFVAMQPYSDAVTYDLVGATARVLSIAPETVLETFGEYWTTFTIEEGYGEVLALMGDSLEEFLDNLDSLHARIGGTMPMLVPPGFEREPQADGSHILHYRTERSGLEPMVVGLLRGIAQRFEAKLEIERLESVADGHHRFLLRRVA